MQAAWNININAQGSVASTAPAGCSYASESIEGWEGPGDPAF
jgi:hypothetical protein